ncbi:MAG: GGDEF domain-containing protein, partial [Sulfurimonas sp.]
MFYQYLQKLLTLGVSNKDSEAVRLKKMSLTMLPLIIGPAGFLWALVYLSLGHFFSAAIPMIHTLFSILGLWHFHRTKNIVFLQKTQLYLTLLLPFFLMWSLGGFAQGSIV